MMSDYEYHGVAGGGLLVILILAIFWHACLTKMGEVLFGKINESPQGEACSWILEGIAVSVSW